MAKINVNDENSSKYLYDDEMGEYVKELEKFNENHEYEGRPNYLIQGTSSGDDINISIFDYSTNKVLFTT